MNSKVFGHLPFACKRSLPRLSERRNAPAERSRCSAPSRLSRDPARAQDPNDRLGPAPYFSLFWGHTLRGRTCLAQNTPQNQLFLRRFRKPLIFPTFARSKNNAKTSVFATFRKPPAFRLRTLPAPPVRTAKRSCRTLALLPPVPSVARSGARPGSQ